MCVFAEMHGERKSRETIVVLCAVLVRPHIEYCVEFWLPQYKKVIKLLECPKEGYKLVKGLEGKTYDQFSQSPVFFSLEIRRLRGGFLAAYSFFTREIKGRPCSLLCGDSGRT